MRDDEEARESEGDGLTGHEAYENVQRQKQGIIDLMAKGDWQNARKYTEQLLQNQIGRGDASLAAKSLCDLAQKAKGFCNYSFQLELAKMAIEISPNDGWAHGHVGDAHFCLGRYEEALKHFGHAACLGEEAFAASGRARVLRGQSQLDEALAAYEQAISEYPTEMSAWLGRAEVLRDLWRLDDALDAYRKAAHRFPEESVPKCGTAAVLSNLGRLAEASAAYKQCFEEHEDSVVARCGQADVLRLMGHLDEALEAYEEASRHFPLEVVPRSGRAQVLKDKGLLDEALREYKVVSAQFSHEVVSANGVAEVLRKMGRLPESLEAYSEVNRRFPRDAVSKCGRANVLKQMERFDDALQAYDGIVAEFPYNVFAWSARADLLKELGHLDSAIAAYDKVIERPWNPKKQGAQVAKAAIFVVMGKWRDAEGLLPGGKPRTRDEWIAWHVRGMILLRSGRLSESVTLFKKALHEIPFADERKYFESALVVANLRLERFDEAVRSLGQDQSPLMNVLRIHAFGAAKRIIDARAAYDSSEGHCPPALVELRNALAEQFRLRPSAKRRRWTWFFEQECRAILLSAA
ncbi:MAG: tetratricopeptide repeat protein [Chloroflexi bacterium]|nr:tetratricopeptide repeat protein [Chloroflexota bacterium]